MQFARTVVLSAGLIVLMLVGATAATLVFHNRVAQLVARWEAAPSTSTRSR